jgi:hypothetical protein
VADAKGLLREITARTGPTAAQARFHDLVGPSMEKGGWTVATDSPGAIGWSKLNTPSGAMVVLMPMFSWLVDRSPLWLGAQFVETSTGTTIAISGTVPGDAEIEQMLDHVEGSIDA